MSNENNAAAEATTVSHYEAKRAELLEELTGPEIYGQISAQVFEKHKLARIELEKLQAQASGVLLLSDEQQQVLQQSLQVLTDEEKQQGLF